MFALLRASHLPPACAVTAIATALAVSAGRGMGAVAVAAAVGAGQLSVGWSNDYLDRDRDRAAQRRDKPIVAGQVAAATVRWSALAAVVFCVPLSLLSGWRSGLLHLCAVGSAWAYNLGIKATVSSPLPYIVAFGALPAVVTLGLAGHPWPPWWATVAGVLLGSGAHLLNTLGDIDDDLRAGVRGLPQRLGHDVSLRLGVGLMAAAALVVALAPPGRPGVVAVLVLVVTEIMAAAVLVAAGLGHHRAAWALTIGTAVAAMGLLLASGHALA
jgi:4-hydroxybenzoate polyprenyltransferase